ncbi:MAG: GPO family capsid scaffolding protein [Nitrospinae bacterium]|nr:GPO family capsid scaffolding protein [Nitrospinota bacterium]
MRDLVELEISRAGSYPQGEITMEDLEEIARAYDPLLHEAPLVLDHAPPGEEHRGPAYGWVKELKRLGDTLVARISQVPAELKELVSSGRYKHRSAEVYLDFQGTGKKYLKRVALLGAAVPAVKGLEPITFTEGSPEAGPSMTVDFEQLTQAEEEDRMGTTNNERLEKLGEAEVAKVVEETVAEVTKRFEEQLKEKDQEAATFKERAFRAERRAAELEESIAKLYAEAAETEVAAFCEGLVSQGKATPAEAKDLKITLLALPDDEASLVTYSASGEEATPRARLMKTYEARKSGSAVPLSEVAADAGASSDVVTFGDGEERIRVPKSVVRLYEKNRADFVKMGVSLEELARSEHHHQEA